MVEAATPNSPDPSTPDPVTPDPAATPDPSTPDPATPTPEPTSLLDDKEDKSLTPADWPSDWRQKLAGDDEKALSRLERMKSPADVFKSYRELEKKLATANIVDELPDDATDEQVAEWRQKNGIPEDPKGYLENLPDGLVFGEDDEKILDDFVSRMHNANVKPEVVQEALMWYKGYQEQVETAQVEQDREFRKTAEDELRGEWGPEYRANINSITNFLSTAPDGLSEQLMGARLADGSLLGNNPTALRWLANLAHEANPAGFVAPSNGKDQSTTIQDELDQIREVRRSDPNKYWKDEKMQARELQLLEAKEKLAS